MKITNEMKTLFLLIGMAVNVNILALHFIYVLPSIQTVLFGGDLSYVVALQIAVFILTAALTPFALTWYSKMVEHLQFGPVTSGVMVILWLMS